MSTCSYIMGLDMALVVDRKTLGPLAAAWDSMERKLMVREARGSEAESVLKGL